MITKDEFTRYMTEVVLPQVGGMEAVEAFKKLRFRLLVGILLSIMPCFFGVFITNSFGFWGYFTILLSLLIFGFLTLVWCQLRLKIKMFQNDILTGALAGLNFEPAEQIFHADFLKQSRLPFLGQKIENTFKGRGVYKDFYMTSSVLERNDKSFAPLLLILIPFQSATSQVVALNQKMAFKFSLFGFSKIDPLFSHAWFDENLVFAKNKEMAPFIITANFVDKIEKVKQILQENDSETAEVLKPRIDISFFNGQMLMAIYTQTKFFDLFDFSSLDKKNMPQDPILTFEKFYSQAEKVEKVIDILSR